MKKYILILICLTIVISAGCYKDKGNYDLIEINKINATADVKDTIKLLQFDTARIKMTINQTLAIPEERLTYRWSAYLFSPPLTGVIDQTLSNEKNLNVAVGLRPDKYTLLYTVTDTQTGVSFFKKFYMEVSSVLSEGWLCINEKQNGSRDIDLVNPSGTVIRDIYRTANGGESLPAGAHTVKVLTTFFGSSQNIIILAENDAVRVNYASFMRMERARDWFIQAPAKIRPENYYYNKVGSNAYFVTDGGFYAAQVDTRFGAVIDGDYTISKYTFPSSNGTYTFDSKNQRFLNYSGNKMLAFSTPANAPFDMNQIGKELIFSGPAPSDRYNCLFKNNGENKFYIYQINTGAAAATAIYDVSNATGLKDATNFASSSLYLHMYYTVGNQLYLLDIANNISKVIFSFPANEVVTTMMLKQSLSQFLSYPDGNRALAVGTYNQTEGKVYTFSIDNVGGFVGETFTKSYSGFGKPIQLEYKARR